MRAIAAAHGLHPWSTDVPRNLDNKRDVIYFDFGTTSMREKNVLDAINAGKHVYCEKPLAISTEAALKLAAKAGVGAAHDRAGGWMRIVRGAVSPDHIHLLVAAPPQLAPAKLVQYLKGRSSRMLQEEFPHLRKRYWGQHLWARGYFCATVGTVDEKTIQEYIENQKWDEDAESSKINSAHGALSRLQPGALQAA